MNKTQTVKPRKTTVKKLIEEILEDLNKEYNKLNIECGIEKDNTFSNVEIWIDEKCQTNIYDGCCCDVALIFDGGSLWSIINNEFGYTLSDDFYSRLDKKLKKYSVYYEPLTSWAIGFYIE